jgi:hypothetical protein
MLNPTTKTMSSYDSIAKLKKKLNANAESLHSTQGSERFGTLQLAVPPAVYGKQPDTIKQENQEQQEQTRNGYAARAAIADPGASQHYLKKDNPGDYHTKPSTRLPENVFCHAAETEERNATTVRPALDFHSLTRAAQEAPDSQSLIRAANGETKNKKRNATSKGGQTKSPGLG